MDQQAEERAASRGDRRPARSPFATAAPGILVALGYLLALLVLIAADQPLGGGRRLAVHLFTLGW